MREAKAMKTNLTINCTQEQLEELLAAYCRRWLSENEKPAGAFGDDGQRASDKGVEVEINTIHEVCI
ncbi:MAG: hypothetical protein CVV42_10690 [Candidatus Riflebacteria bacterium HGW-Riflebacteria-2]|jgi:hypothetical protein|nr:MAG: hypothetical protein CVV42_10690 [Candidatus Riflebacteria bacterium HGW-Riflebacteria-2]